MRNSKRRRFTIPSASICGAFFHYFIPCLFCQISSVIIIRPPPTSSSPSPSSSSSPSFSSSSSFSLSAFNSGFRFFRCFHPILVSCSVSSGGAFSLFYYQLCPTPAGISSCSCITHTHTLAHTHIYICFYYIYMCVCVCE